MVWTFHNPYDTNILNFNKGFPLHFFLLDERNIT